jgi:DNA repair protein RadA/Sms
MKNDQTIYVCSNCGEEYLKWQGKCDNCGQWNSLKEFKVKSEKLKTKMQDIEIVDLSKVKTANFGRISSRISEFDRVLGGGFVKGSLVLLGGEPGIGKSTLVMQVAANLGAVLYISGEESLTQIKMRAERLKIKTSQIKLLTETNIDVITQALANAKFLPSLIIVDSIQTIYSENFPSTAGSLVQVRECALRLQRLAKETNIPVILVGHVTKEGAVAGPKTLEHMVDVVMYLEGERYHGTRILRTAKNRFGATDEIGIFEIENSGLKEIKNPSKIFLSDRNRTVPGSVITATIEGTRPLLTEIQALVSPTSFGYPRRTASGFDLNRLNLIIAILINRAGLKLGGFDVYLNVAGGFYLKEPAGDLAVALAIASAYKNFLPSPKLVAFGELGLGGEIRAVTFENKRLAEAKRLGLTKFLKSKNIWGAIKEITNA